MVHSTHIHTQAPKSRYLWKTWFDYLMLQSSWIESYFCVFQNIKHLLQIFSIRYRSYVATIDSDETRKMNKNSIEHWVHNIHTWTVHSNHANRPNIHSVCVCVACVHSCHSSINSDLFFRTTNGKTISLRIADNQQKACNQQFICFVWFDWNIIVRIKRVTVWRNIWNIATTPPTTHK